MKKKIFLVPFLLTFQFSFGQDPLVTTIDFSDSSQVVDWMSNYGVPGLGIVHLKEAKVSSIHTFGERRKGQPIEEETLFNVASLTKPIVSTLVIKLVDNNEWDLNTPLSTFYVHPDLEGHPYLSILNTEHILRHQSGFLNWKYLEEDGRLKFHFKPGTEMNYSGEGYEYLRLALEKKFQKPLEVLVRQFLFDPLGMEKSFWHFPTEVDTNQMASWHNKEGILAYPLASENQVNAADDLITTLVDFGKFGASLLQKNWCSDQLFAQITSADSLASSGAQMGMGWEILNHFHPSHYALVHTGGDYGVQTIIILMPTLQEGLIIFTNGDQGNQLYFPIIKHFLSLGKSIVGEAQK